MILTQICDLPEGTELKGIRPNRASTCVLVLDVEKNVAFNSPCAFYVTDFTFNIQTTSEACPTEYDFDNVRIPRGQVLKLLVFHKHFPRLDLMYRRMYGQELGLQDWYDSNPGHSKKSLLTNLLVLTTNIQLKMYDGHLECPSYDYSIVGPTDQTREVQLLFKNMVKELPKFIFTSNKELAEKAIPLSCLKFLSEFSASERHQSDLQSQIVPTSTFDEGYSEHNSIIDDMEHADDYIPTPRLSKLDKSEPCRIGQLIQMENTLDNNIYTVNARVIDTIPSDWSLLCGKRYKIRNGKPHIMDPVPLDIELILIDAEFKDKSINATNSLSIYLTGENVMKLLGIDTVEEMYTTVASTYEKFIEYTSKPHKFELCKKTIKIMEGESIVVWTIFNPSNIYS